MLIARNGERVSDIRYSQCHRWRQIGGRRLCSRDLSRKLSIVHLDRLTRSHGSVTELDVLLGVISGSMKVGQHTLKDCSFGRPRARLRDNCELPSQASYHEANVRSFLIGRKGLKEDLKRFEEAGDRRLQRLVTEYKEHEVSYISRREEQRADLQDRKRSDLFLGLMTDMTSRRGLQSSSLRKGSQPLPPYRATCWRSRRIRALYAGLRPNLHRYFDHNRTVEEALVPLLW
jgi:hypothetical protein